MFSVRLLNISRSGVPNQAMLLVKHRSVPWVLAEGEASKGRDPTSNRRARSADARMSEGGIVKRLLLYVIPLSAIAVLVFATIAVAQGVPQGQEPSQNPATGHTTDVQNSTTWPPKKKPADTSTPTETADTSAPTETAETTAPDPNGQKTVNIYNHAFDPAQLNVASGTTVRFVNKDTEAHTATADNNLFDTGVLEPGESFKVYFEGSGTVTYHCELHPDMKGSIVVGEGGGGEAAAPQQSVSKEAPTTGNNGNGDSGQSNTATDSSSPIQVNDSEPSSEADQPAPEAAKNLKG